MSEIEPFKFEETDNRGRKEESFVQITDLGVRIKRDCDDFETRYKHDSITGIALTALLAERTRHKDVFARLMEVAREMSMAQNYVYDDKLDALQREWEGK